MDSDRTHQPLDAVAWVPRANIRPNDYNPNAVPPPELRLLRISLLEDGWTQPIVVHRDTNVIVDGEHRWTVAADPEVAGLTGGLVPVVYVEGDLAHRMMSTVRHNRARGEHGVRPMAGIVRALLESGCEKEDVMVLLQMEEEEVDRLAERAGMPEVVGRQGAGFNAGWVPG
jgi:ParB-like chromosome segregation protein Spo0J